MADTTIEFYGGVRVIGGSKIMISTPSARVLLDMGLDIPGGADLFRAPVQTRQGHELADYLAVGHAPRLPGIYDPAQLTAYGTYAEGLAELATPDPRPTAVFISHAHIDHDGLLGFVRPDVPVYGHPDTVRVHRALGLTGMGPAGNPVQMQEIRPGEPMAVGDLQVEGIPVSHDVPGACGYLVTTPDGRVAYTGDINFHRDGGAASRAFVDRVRGVDALVSETTMLSFDPPEGEEPHAPATEGEVVATFEEACRADALILVSLYERDIERAQSFVRAAADVGRTLVWPGQIATFLQAMGVDGVVTWDGSRPQRAVHAAAVEASPTAVKTIGLDEVHANPSAYAVQLDPRDNPAMLDLPLTPDSVWVHSQGEPLGPFMDEWAPFMDWLQRLGVAHVHAGSTGHAPGTDLISMVEGIAPRKVFAIHGFRPERLSTGVPTVLPEYGTRYTV